MLCIHPCLSVCLFVCLLVCLFVSRITQKVMDGFERNIMRRWPATQGQFHLILVMIRIADPDSGTKP